jgi:heme/copper-type cytochrome/quinol oxidase subunit 2
MSTAPLLTSTSSSGPKTSDPLRAIVDASAVLGNSVRTGLSDASQITQNLGLSPAPAPVAPPKEDHGAVILVVGLLVLVGVVGVVIYVVRRGHK